jgi:hypothetical protein
MTRIAAPMSVCQQVSQRAVQLAREDIASRGWSNKSIEAITALPGEGTVGLKTAAKYLMYQERGIKPFVMYWVNGRTVGPMKGPGGTVSFRRGGHAGEPGWVTLPGGVRKWRDQRWRHPGLGGSHFMEDALRKAIAEARPSLKQVLMTALKGEGNA